VFLEDSFEAKSDLLNFKGGKKKGQRKVLNTVFGDGKWTNWWCISTGLFVYRKEIFSIVLLHWKCV